MNKKKKKLHPCHRNRVSQVLHQLEKHQAQDGKYLLLV